MHDRLFYQIHEDARRKEPRNETADSDRSNGSLDSNTYTGRAYSKDILVTHKTWTKHLTINPIIQIEGKKQIDQIRERTH